MESLCEKEKDDVKSEEGKILFLEGRELEVLTFDRFILSWSQRVQVQGGMICCSVVLLVYPQSCGKTDGSEAYKTSLREKKKTTPTVAAALET